MTEYFKGIDKIDYEGSDSRKALAFKYYNPKKKVLGKTMAEHLRFAVCYWHTFKSAGDDMFGAGTFDRPWNQSDDPMERAEMTLDAAFEFFQKLGVDFWCFHDRDIAPEADNLEESNRRLEDIAKLAKKKQKETGIKLLWGTTNAFSHPRFMSGAATNPDPEIFAYAASQVKKAMEITKELNGQGYVFWGGREGYETLLNTDMKREMEHLARFLHMAVDHKQRIGFKGQFYIEPKPKEPTKHQYDFDSAACYAFLQKYDLVDYFKINVENNHATLAKHTFQHELEYCAANGILGSVDANQGDLFLGWDTDEFPSNLYDTTLAMYTILKAGGFTTGGLNFDAHVRRQSIDLEDLFHAHVGAMDAYARGLLNAAKMLKGRKFDRNIERRYKGWDAGIGKKIEKGQVTFEDLEKYTLQNSEPKIQSGRQEMLENTLNDYI